MTYYADVKFLDDCDPPLIERNGEEFKRMHALLQSVVHPVKRAEDLHWTSASRTHYEARLRDVDGLVTGLMDGFETAWKALAHYADAVAAAQVHLKTGKHCQEQLAAVIARVGEAITSEARAAEPMHQWEDLRSTTGFFDWLAELTVDVDSIRDEANSWHDQASNAFQTALRTEKPARERCLSELQAACEFVPELRTKYKDASALMDRVGALQAESQQAGQDPNTHLAGSGRKADYFPGVGGNVIVSPTLMRIQQLCADLPPGKDNNYWLPSNSDQHRREWISANKQLINAAAAENGLPPDMIAGIAWQEVEGDPAVVDDIADKVRGFGIGGNADETSMGPMSIQVRRAAEVLGYDPHHLSDTHRDQVVSAIRDPAQNIFITSKYLSQLKAESGFADVPAGQMTPQQYQELAARYNGGPYWQSNDAQAYGRGFMNNVGDAQEALR